MRILDSQVTIRVDLTTGFVSLLYESILLSHGIVIDVRCTKNIAKNLVAEHDIAELCEELICYNSSTKTIFDMTDCSDFKA